MKALVGGRTDVTNYGYIAVKDHNGEYQAGFPYETEYNYATEMFTCKMLKKFDSPIIPAERCCDYLLINGCYVKINAQKIIL
jgi:hypothetical protein